jgi:chaperonin GroES
MKFKVMHDRVLIRKIEPENVTTGGIVLTGNNDPVYEAMVVAIGSGKPVKGGTPIPLTVQVGDKVMYNPSSTVAVMVGGESLLVIKEDDIFAIM